MAQDKKLQKLELTWIGKDDPREAIEPRILIENPDYSYGTVETGTLPNGKPWNGNMLIHGDNLLALKALEENYTNAVKCIYIDPPYNTGNAFEHYDDGLEHSIWLSLMRERLIILRNLLTEDGSIWITLDDNEAHYFKVMCDEIFGRHNFVATTIWQHSKQSKGYPGKFSLHHNYTFCYKKSEHFFLNSLERTEEHNKNYSNPDNDPNGPWRSGDVRNSLVRPNLMYDIHTPSGKIIHHPEKGWRFSKETFEKELAEGKIIFSEEVTLDYNAGSGRALLNLGNDMRYVLDHIDKYIRPLQDKGRKVCICLEGGGSGLGFCNLTDTQIEDFVAQVKAVITAYELDGVNFWDRNAGYGKEGMPAMNTTSYPKLIKAMREALGNDKLVTLTDFEEPTEYFWDTAATGGIEVGQYLDYAWSGYLNNEKEIQIVDPWHQGEQYVSTDYPRKPIAGLDPSKYGCVNIPWYASEEKTPMDYLVGIFHWRNAGNKQSNILVYEDLRTVLQDNLESTWTDSFKYGYTFFADDGTWLIEESKWGLSILSDNEYEFNPFFLAQVDGGSGYNKWLKDW